MAFYLNKLAKHSNHLFSFCCCGGTICCGILFTRLTDETEINLIHIKMSLKLNKVQSRSYT